MNEIVFEKDYEVNSVNINLNKRLGLYGMLGILQDVGTIHAEILGVGYEQMLASNNFWVFIQQKIRMQRWPQWRETIRVRTWPRKIAGLKAYRDYAIFVGDEKIGDSVAAFMVLNGETRRPVAPQIDESIHTKVTEKVLDYIPEKIQLPATLELKNTITVRNSDLDMNNHVNNTKYSQWILDSIPIDYHRQFVVQEFDINFIAETHLGDQIDIHLLVNDDGSDVIDSYYQGVRKSDKKVVFTSKIIGRKV